MIRIAKHAVGALAAFAFAAPAIQAQNYPDRPIRLIVGYAAGGGPDITARSTGQALSQLLGQPVIVENRLGAGGVISGQTVASAPPDGHTLLIGETGQLAIVPHLMKNLPYDPMKDLAPVCLITSSELLLAAHPKSGIRTIQQLVAEARANPGKLSYGSSGIGTVHHLAMEIFLSDLGLNIVHVPFKGSGQAVPALLAGDVPLLLTGIPVVTPYARAGRVTLLGVTSAIRAEAVPDVPPMADVDKGFDYTVEIGLLAPAATPPAIIRKLADAVKTAMQSPELLKRYHDGSLTTKYLPSEGYAALLRRNYLAYEKAVKAANIRAN